MTAHGFLDEMNDLDITCSHSRPRVSNDNVFSESQFKTQKYQPDYPGRFDSVVHARHWCDQYFKWYNIEHHRSGLSGYTPAQVFTNTHPEIAEHKQRALDARYQSNPGRFVKGPPVVKLPPESVAINPISDSHSVRSYCCWQAFLVTEFEDETGNIMKKKQDLISKVMEIEWPMFSSVSNRGGKASCQENPDTFKVIRTSTFMTWSEATIESYLGDLTQAKEADRNMMYEKYARMEGISAPVDAEVLELIDKIAQQECLWAEDLLERHPGAKLARPIYSSQDTADAVSSETYSRGELATYSKKTLELYLQDILEMREKDVNRIEQAIALMAEMRSEKSEKE